MIKCACSTLFAALFTMYTPYLLAGDLSGRWLMRTAYGGKYSSEVQLSIAQNGSELMFSSKATSNKNIPGRGWGRVSRFEKGSETIAMPRDLVEMTRIDDTGNYIAKFIGVIDSSNTIEGYFVDVNGTRGSFKMEKQAR